MSTSYDNRRSEILDGKRSWFIHGDAAGDADVFHTEFLLPLRELRNHGMFESLKEVGRHYRGQKQIARIDIVGGINLEG